MFMRKLYRQKDFQIMKVRGGIFQIRFLLRQKGGGMLEKTPLKPCWQVLLWQAVSWRARLLMPDFLDSVTVTNHISVGDINISHSGTGKKRRPRNEISGSPDRSSGR